MLAAPFVGVRFGMADASDGDRLATELCDNVRDSAPEPLNGRQEHAARLLARGFAPGRVALRIGIHRNTLSAWRKLPAFVLAEADWKAELNAEVRRSLHREWKPSIARLAKIRDLPFDAVADDGSDEGPSGGDGAISEFAVTESRLAAKALADMQLKLHIAQLAIDAKTAQDDETAEDKAARIREALRAADASIEPPPA